MYIYDVMSSLWDQTGRGHLQAQTPLDHWTRHDIRSAALWGTAPLCLARLELWVTSPKCSHVQPESSGFWSNSTTSKTSLCLTPLMTQSVLFHPIYQISSPEYSFSCVLLACSGVFGDILFHSPTHYMLHLYQTGMIVFYYSVLAAQTISGK